MIADLILTPTGISGGLLLSAAGDLQAGDEVPLLAPEVCPRWENTYIKNIAKCKPNYHSSEDGKYSEKLPSSLIFKLYLWIIIRIDGAVSFVWGFL